MKRQKYLLTVRDCVITEKQSYDKATANHWKLERTKLKNDDCQTPVVAEAHTVVDPRTMVIHLQDALPTNLRMHHLGLDQKGEKVKKNKVLLGGRCNDELAVVLKASTSKARRFLTAMSRVSRVSVPFEPLAFLVFSYFLCQMESLTIEVLATADSLKAKGISDTERQKDCA